MFRQVFYFLILLNCTSLFRLIFHTAGSKEAVFGTFLFMDDREVVTFHSVSNFILHGNAKLRPILLFSYLGEDTMYLYPL